MIYSPDCKLLIAALNAKGLTNASHRNKIIRYGITLIFIQLFQCYLITRQMDSTRTPSALAKVSYVTFILQGVLDFFTAIGHLAIGVVLENQASMTLVSEGGRRRPFRRIES